jgi:hypothetical protein
MSRLGIGTEAGLRTRVCGNGREPDDLQRMWYHCELGISFGGRHLSRLLRDFESAEAGKHGSDDKTKPWPQGCDKALCARTSAE